MIVYHTEQQYLDALDEGHLVPMQPFVVIENKLCGFAFSTTERVLFVTADSIAQLTGLYVQGDLTVNGTITSP